jgi:hypothetical protein
MKTITVSDELCEKLMREQAETLDLTGLKDLIGKSFFFRTVTYHLTGKVKKVFGSFLVLEQAAWIPDSGRFMQTILEGNINECEPIGVAIINLSTVTDFFPWKHSLPKEQK